MTNFDDIKREYAKRRGQLIMKNRSQHLTRSGYFASSNPDHIFQLFRKIDLRKYRSFVDLGSGDGIVAAIAQLFTVSTGVESDPDLHAAAVEIRQRLGMNHILLKRDFLEQDLAPFDCIFINPDNYFHRLEKKLVGEFKGTIIIADNIFRPLTLTPDHQLTVLGTSYSVYKLR